MSTTDRPSVTDNASAEAERRWGDRRTSDRLPIDWLDEGMASGFVLGAQWAAGRAETTTTPTEDAAGIDRAEVRRVLENEFWPFLAHDPHDPDRFWGLAVDAVMGLLATARTRPTAPAELLPAESIALTVALAQVRRGDEPDPNTAAMCVLALARLAGRHDWTEDDQ